MPPTIYKEYSLEVRACILRVAKEAKDWKAAAELHGVNDRSAFTLQKLHRDVVNRNSPINKQKRYDYVVKLKLGPYSPMLNPIENVFSVYKSAVKRFLARRRPAILRVPDGVTITEHQAGFLELAADPLFTEVVTPELCNRTFCHSLPHHQRALPFEDMQVGA
ncbi:unnamed protein product [Phytophthora fragariaefolia]|uniref:Unnamed protein product n=1 Tax=Phytophthora fragariaefolia TaxID=1490495 RepID=A0A9W7D194_9STRA|nr:unnamed protein product [Phytophthora fragariaefolia]